MQISPLLRRCLPVVFALFSITSLNGISVDAQDKQYTENRIDASLRSDARVDSSTLGMSLEIPFGGAPGRAGATLPSALRYSSKQWRINYLQVWDNGYIFDVWTKPKFSENAKAGWTSSLNPPRIEYSGKKQGFQDDGDPISDHPEEGNDFVCYIPRVHLLLPDGSSHELRKSDVKQCFPNYVPDPAFDFAGVFYSTDGSRMRFDNTAGVLYLPDGGRYLFGAEPPYAQPRYATQYLDRNGNTISYSLTSATDTLGRTYTNPLANDPVVGDQSYSVAGVGGVNLNYTLRWRNLADALSNPSAGLSYTASHKCIAVNNYPSVSPSPYLFTSPNTHVRVCAEQNPFNPVVLAEILLPNGRSYQFKYNAYAEIDKVIYPTGGYERFLYAYVPTLADVNWPYDQANRGVVDRWVSTKGDGTDEVHWHYSGGSTVSITAPDSTRTDRLLHYSTGVAYFGFDNPLAGMAYDERTYNAAGQMLRRTLTDWATEISAESVARNPYVVRSVNLILDTGGDALAGNTTMQYDADLNVISTSRYSYASVNAATAQTGAISLIPLGTVMRTEEATYLVNDTNIDATTRAAYRARNLLGLVSSARVKNAAGIVAQSSVSYDEATYPMLTYGSMTGWTDPGANVKRGNATSSASWLNTTGTWLQTHAQYDQAGNVRKTWDARDTGLTNPSQVTYSDAFSDGVLRNTYAFPTSVTTAIPDPNGAYGSNAAFTTTSVFDFTTGRVTSSTDANNQTTTLEYGVTDGFGNSNPLQRLTRVNNPDGGWTSYAYGETPGNIYIRTQATLDAARAIESYQYFDGLARPYRTYLNEGGGSYLVTDTEYEQLGRVWHVSNPYRSTSLNGTINPSGMWTTNVYDALGRVLTVTTPDSAVVSTSYVGNTVTVTDQTGKKRKSVTDALGRLKEVYEDPTGLNYLTSYSYDALDNLTSVSQGVQTRTFVYDSLKRLTSATNPESGTISYGYDNNGNLTQKTDARGVISTYAYDALNRNRSVVYTNDPAGTPAVYRYYDGFRAGANNNILNSKGRLWQSETAGANASRATSNSFDATGRPSSVSQQFYAGAAWSPSFTVGRQYNLAGGVTLQTYPSGHTVTYNYDAAGRLGDKDSLNVAFSGKLGDGVPRNYSTEITYSTLGGMTKEKFGTDTALYNKTIYNSRGQAAEIRVGTYHPTDNTWWNRGAIINHYSDSCWGSCGGSSSTTPMTDNNGNLKKQDIYIPNTDVPNTQLITNYTTWWQQYNYDALNRLDWVRETANDAEVWKQDFSYDRYGNRTIDQTNTWGPATGPAINKKNFTVNTANNRLGVPAGQGGAMSYDNAGNLITDTYSGAGVTRTYDAENRMTSETQANNYMSGSYSYNADGQRVRRKVGSVETWQIYGMDGELLAEYAVNASAGSPQKEYGYRNGQLLITADAPSTARSNVALASSGAVASSSSNYSGAYPASAANNGDRKGVNWGNGGGWHDVGPGYSFPDWLQIDFAASKTINEVDVLTVQDSYASPAEPTEAMSFSLYGLTGYEVQYWNGSAWVTVSGGSISGSNKVWKKLTFPAITTSKIRVLTNASVDGYSRLTEVEAWGIAAVLPNNVALAANGAVATSSSNYSGAYPASAANNGDRKGVNWGNGGGWHDVGPGYSFPDWLQIDFAASKTINEVDVLTVQDSYASPAEPTEAMSFSLYGLTGYEVQYWNGSAWVTVSGGSISGNNKVWKKLTFPAITTSKIRVLTNASVDGYSRLTEVEAWEASGAGLDASINWLVADQLGTPRMVFDKTGSLATVKRHDYLPFGEELFAGTGARTPTLGYVGDSVRQKFTSKERDNETGLDYFNARYYASTQGRFTSPDPFGGSGFVSVPQSWNKYTYCLNRPFVFTDPSGLIWLTTDNQNFIWVEDDEYEKNQKQYKGYSVANGAVTNYQSSTNCPSCANVSSGQWVQLNANGSVTGVPNPTTFIYAQYSDDEISNPIPVIAGSVIFKDLEGGPPNGKWIFPNKGGGRTERLLDNNGRAYGDVDYGHDHGAGDPHVHWWDWTGHRPKRGEGEPVPEGFDFLVDDGGSLVVVPSAGRRSNSPMAPLFMPTNIPFRPGVPFSSPVFLRPVLVP